MKTLIATVLSFVSISAFAASVKITSFNYVRTSGDTFRSPLAELCGTVEGATSEITLVKVTVDPKNKPAIYNTVVGPEGKFCLAVITYRGDAEAEVNGVTTEAVIK